MDVGINSPVTVQRSPTLTFSPPATSLSIASPTISQSESSPLPPPAQELMASPQPSDPVAPIDREVIPTSTAPASESLTSTAPATVAVSEQPNHEASSGQTSTPGQDTPSSEPAETLQERLARAQEQVRELERQIAQANAGPGQTNGTDFEAEDNQRTTESAPAEALSAVPAQSDASHLPTPPESGVLLDSQNIPAIEENAQDASVQSPPINPATDSDAGQAAPLNDDQVAEPAPAIGQQELDALFPDMVAVQSPAQPVPPADEPNPEVSTAEDTIPPPPPPPDQTDEEPAADGDGVPAEWADIEEDLSTPDEQEMKEIDARNDVPATDVKYHENSFYADAPEDPEQVPIQKMRLTWVIKGLRGTKDKPNRSRILNSPAVQVGGYWWNLKFFPRGNKSPALSAYVNCSRRKPEADEALPEHTFSAFYGAPDADLGEVKPAVEISTPALGTDEDKTEKAAETVAEDDDSKKPAEANDVQPEVPENAGTTTEEKQAPAEDEDDNEDWRVSAQIGIIIYNPDEPRTKTDNAACHQFNKYNEDWGWTSFHGPWSEIHKRKEKQRTPLLQKDTIALDAYIRIFSDPSQALWWHTCNAEDQWNSFSLTGIPAMGTSGIFSSNVAGVIPLLLLAPFRKIFQEVNVEGFRTSSAARPRSLCSQLQMILYLMRKLKKDDRFVSLDSLTELLEKLDESGTDVITFWEAFRRSLELELESEPEAVQKLADIFDSGASKDQAMTRWTPTRIPAEGSLSIQNGLKESFDQAEAKHYFPKFFPVEIERQKFDSAIRQWKLLYDRVRLDEELDLSPWSLDPDRAKYTLYGFVVHAGERNSGNFYSILRPHGPGTKWLAFEDGSPNQVVSHTKHKIQEFEGLEGEELKDNIKSPNTAYIAIYIRNDCLQDFLTKTLEPFELSPWLKNCPQISNRIEAKDAGQYDDEIPDDVDLEIYSSDRIKDLPGLFDIHTLKSSSGPDSPSRVRHLTVSGETTYQELRHKLAKWYQVDNVEKIKMFIMQPSSPAAPLVCSFKRISKLYKGVTDVYSSTQPHCLWVRILETDEAVKNFGDPEPPADLDAFDRTSSETASQISETPEIPPANIAPAVPANEDTTATDTQNAAIVDGESTPVAAAETTSSPTAPTFPADESADVSGVTANTNIEPAVTTNAPESELAAPGTVAEPASDAAPAQPTAGETDQESSEVVAVDQPHTVNATNQVEIAANAVTVEEPFVVQDGSLPVIADSENSTMPSDSTPVASSDLSTQSPSAEAPSTVQPSLEPDNGLPETVNAEVPNPPATEISRASPAQDTPAATEPVAADDTGTAEPDIPDNRSPPDADIGQPPVAEADETRDQPPSDVTPAPVQDGHPGEETSEPLAGVLSAEDEALIAALYTEDLANDVAHTTAPPVPAETTDIPPADLGTIQNENPPPAPPDAAVTQATESPPVTQETNDETRSETTDEEEVVTRRPQPFNYGFIQLFEAEKQDFVVHSDFFALRSDDVKEFVRKHLGYSTDKAFHIWRRTEAYRLVPILSSTSFSEIKSSSEYREDGFVLVVCEALSDSSKAALTAASKFVSPEPLSHYLWFSARNHPVKAHSGEITVSKMGLEYYKGGLFKGLYSGIGKHITPTGHSYEGPFLAGMRSTSDEHPSGECVYSNGDKYTGGWAQNEKHGKGEFIEKRTNNRYVGGYQEGKRWGQGVTYWEVADEESEMCQICYSEAVDSLFFDCGHVCACVDCAKQVEVCPICRKSIKQVVKIWKA